MEKEQSPGTLLPRNAEARRHRFSGRRRLVEQRRVRERQAGQIGHHRLEVQQRLQATL
jgi:hypothetical protein